MTEDFVPTTRFVKNLDLSDGKATAILDCLKTVLKENHVPPPVLSKVFGLGSDGASVMTRPQGRSECINEGKPMLVKFTSIGFSFIVMYINVHLCTH